MRLFFTFLFYFISFVLFNSSQAFAGSLSDGPGIDEKKYLSVLNTILGKSNETDIATQNITLYKAPKHAISNHRYIVKLDPNCPFIDKVDDYMDDVFHSLGCAMEYGFSSTHGCHVSYQPSASNPTMPLDLLMKLPCLSYIEEAQIMKTSQIQSPIPWGLDRIDQSSSVLDQKYGFNLSGKNTHIYVIDSGIDISHPEFKGRADLAYTVNSISDQTRKSSTDCSGHGTHVSGIIAGNIVGIAKDAYIHAVRVLGCEDSTNADVVEAIDWIIANHKKPAIINMSLGALPDPVTKVYKTIPSIDDAITRAIKAGIVVTMAAGNFNTNLCTGSPANISNLFIVGASNLNDANQDIKASFSNYGPCLDIFAPGVNVISSSPGGKYISLSGSSQASPHVAGVAALVLEAFPNFSPEDVKKSILNIATKEAIKGAPNTTSLLLRAYSTKSPLDSSVTTIASYPDSLQSLLSNTPRSSPSMVVIIIMISVIFTMFVLYISFKIIQRINKRKVDPSPFTKSIDAEKGHPHRESMSDLVPIFFAVSKSKRTSSSEFGVLNSDTHSVTPPMPTKSRMRKNSNPSVPHSLRNSLVSPRSSGNNFSTSPTRAAFKHPELNKAYPSTGNNEDPSLSPHSSVSPMSNSINFSREISKLYEYFISSPSAPPSSAVTNKSPTSSFTSSSSSSSSNELAAAAPPPRRKASFRPAPLHLTTSPVAPSTLPLSPQPPMSPAHSFKSHRHSQEINANPTSTSSSSSSSSSPKLTPSGSTSNPESSPTTVSDSKKTHGRTTFTLIPAIPKTDAYDVSYFLKDL